MLLGPKHVKIYLGADTGYTTRGQKCPSPLLFMLLMGFYLFDVSGGVTLESLSSEPTEFLRTEVFLLLYGDWFIALDLRKAIIIITIVIIIKIIIILLIIIMIMLKIKIIINLKSPKDNTGINLKTYDKRME